MVDYNIEFGHIYLNENFSKEHFDGAKIAKDIVKKLQNEGRTFCLTLMVDDYNPDEQFLDLEEYISELTKLGITPDFVVYESSLTKFKDLMLSESSNHISKQYSSYIERKGKCPCSFLISIWHVLRLGLIKDGSAIFSLTNRPISEFYAKNIITILPERFQGVEKMGMDIIKSTKFASKVTRNSQNIFI